MAERVAVRRGFHYAWYVLSVGAVISTIGAGLGFYSTSAYYKPWETEFGWTRGQISLGISLAGLLAAFMSPLLGRWTDRYGPRTVSALGTAAVGGMYIAMAGTGVIPPFVGVLALPFLYATFMTMSVGRVGAYSIPISTVVANWFASRRGLAMGIMSAGISLGGVIVTPFMTYMIYTYGWRTAFIVAGLLAWAIIFPLIVLVLRNRPADLNLPPYGQSEAPVQATGKARETKKSAATVDHAWTLREALRTVPFWCLSFGMGFFYFGNSTIIQHSYPFFTEKGEDVALAAALLSSMAGLGIAGKLLLGWVVDRLSSARLIYAASMLFQGVGLFILLFSNSVPLYWLGVIVIGLSMGGAVALQPVMLGECFGIASFGAILGASSVIVTLWSNLGPLFAGLLHDLTGDYQIALITTVVLEVIAGVIVLFAKPVRPVAREKGERGKR